MTRVWELRDRRLTAFRGDYTAYHRQREERDARAVKDVETQAEAIARERELVQRYRSHRKFSKMHEHEARLERLEPSGARRRGPAAGWPSRPRRWRAAGRRARARSSSGSRTWPSATCPAAARSTRTARRPPEPHVVARAPFLAAQRGERIGIVGPNGAGKTTLLRTIAGDLPPLDGAVTFGNAVQLGYLAQLRGAAIPGTTVLDALLEAIPVTAGEARGYLARFLFRGDDAFKEVRSLSGGERSRLELALLGIQPSNLLLLDEPTNHLDIPAREAIEAFMADVAGDAARRVARPAAARDGVREAVGRRRRGGGAVRRRLSRLARGGRRRLDRGGGAGGGGRAAARREPPAASVGRRPAPDGAAPDGRRRRARPPARRRSPSRAPAPPRRE